jgi:hypothetical protein
MPSRRLVATAALALLAPAVAVHDARQSRDTGLPRFVLWAWERPDDLRGLPRSVGVAFLAQTITISGPSHLVSRRRQPLRVDEGTKMIAVTRIEAPGAVQGVDVAAISHAIVDRARLPMVAGVQIDFDARASQRPMYRQLLHAVRADLPPAMPLSMTALASWCLDDNWLDELPVDEAVPMLFRMGPAAAVLRAQWGIGTVAPKCRTSRGVSLDEAAPRRGGSGRTYVFNPGPWNAAAIRAAVEEDR